VYTFLYVQQKDWRNLLVTFLCVGSKLEKISGGAGPPSIHVQQQEPIFFLLPPMDLRIRVVADNSNSGTRRNKCSA
jgi:hypothetical protein